MFVIDSITFKEINEWGASGYDIYIGNINTMNFLRKYIVENGDYTIDPSQIELYLYDYKIPITNVEFSSATDTLFIYCQEGVTPMNYIELPTNNVFRGPSIYLLWTFDYIPTTSVEAILFVEFAKQYGVDAIKIDGYSVDGYEEDKIIGIALQNSVICHIYGAGNGQFSGQIFRHDI